MRARRYNTLRGWTFGVSDHKANAEPLGHVDDLRKLRCGAVRLLAFQFSLSIGVRQQDEIRA